MEGEGVFYWTELDDVFVTNTTKLISKLVLSSLRELVIAAKKGKSVKWIV